MNKALVCISPSRVPPVELNLLLLDLSPLGPQD
jgi:hypothetical protein